MSESEVRYPGPYEWGNVPAYMVFFNLTFGFYMLWISWDYFFNPRSIQALTARSDWWNVAYFLFALFGIWLLITGLVQFKKNMESDRNKQI